MPGPKGVPRADIIALLREGHSDREIGRRLRTNPKRVGRAAAARQEAEAAAARLAETLRQLQQSKG